jgi:hypothetical protein
MVNAAPKQRTANQLHFAHVTTHKATFLILCVEVCMDPYDPDLFIPTFYNKKLLLKYSANR